MLKSIISRLTMERITCLLIDRVTGEEVNLYIDKYGIEWMAQSKLGWRVRRN